MIHDRWLRIILPCTIHYAPLNTVLYSVLQYKKCRGFANFDSSLGILYTILVLGEQLFGNPTVTMNDMTICQNEPPIWSVSGTRYLYLSLVLLQFGGHGGPAKFLLVASTHNWYQAEVRGRTYQGPRRTWYTSTTAQYSTRFTLLAKYFVCILPLDLYWYFFCKTIANTRTPRLIHSAVRFKRRARRLRIGCWLLSWAYGKNFLTWIQVQYE
jgi:hypothetical protein